MWPSGYFNSPIVPNILLAINQLYQLRFRHRAYAQSAVRKNNCRCSVIPGFSQFYIIVNFLCFAIRFCYFLFIKAILKQLQGIIADYTLGFPVCIFMEFQRVHFNIEGNIFLVAIICFITLWRLLQYGQSGSVKIITFFSAFKSPRTMAAVKDILEISIRFLSWISATDWAVRFVMVFISTRLPKNRWSWQYQNKKYSSVPYFYATSHIPASGDFLHIILSHY